MELRDKNGLTEQEFLAQYKPGNYVRPSMTVDMLIFAAPGLHGTLSIPAFTEHAVKILLIKRGGHPCLGQWALPGGFVNPTETVTQAAYRELEEETGYKSDNVSKLLELRTTVAFCNEMVDVYLAEDLYPGEQHLDDAEDIRVEAHELSELLEMIYSGTMQDAKTVAAILAYACKKNK